MPKSGKHRVNTIDSFFRVRPSSQNIREGENISFLEDGKLIKQEKRNGVVYEQVYVEQNTSEKQRSAAATGDVTNLIVQGSSTGGADITGITAGTGLTGGGASGNISLAIDSTVATLTGAQTLTNKTLTAPTFTGTAQGASLTLTGDLTVQGDTTTLNTATLQVEDKNIVLNYHASNDTSSSAEGAGITIQDAVDASTDATILWDQVPGEFDFSHSINVTGNISVSGTVDGVDIAARDHDEVSLSGSLDYLTISGQTITRNAINLGTDVTSQLPLSNGGTGATNAITARENLGLEIGLDVQAYDLGLLSIAGLTTAANKMIYTTASDTYAVTDLTSTARTLLDDTSTTAMRATLGVDAAGTDNSTDVTLVTTSHDYLSIAGQAITLGTIDIGDDTNLVGGTGITLTGDTLSTTDSEIVHDNLSGYVENEHKDHSAINITAGAGLSGGGNITASRQLALDINSLGSSPQVVRNGSEEIAVWDPDYNTSSGQTAKITLDDVSDYVQSINFTGTTDGVMTLNANGTLTAESALTFNGTLLHISKDVETTGTTGTTLLKLTNDVGTDLSQQKTFVDFTLLDDNSNETPQVRIGAEVGQNGDANTQEKEGSGAFVVYTNNADTTSGDAGASLAERMRVDYQGRVGIGTTSPQDSLHVTGSIRTNGEIYLDAGGDSIAFMGVSDANYRKALYSTNDDHYVTNRHTGGDLILMSNNGSGGGETERLRFVAGSGTQNAYFSNVNLGIGVSNPDSPLHIGNNVATSAGFDSFADYQILLYDSGSSSLSYGLGIYANTLMFNSGGGNYDWRAGNATKMYFDGANGRLGIGTNSPDKKLEVSGDIKISGGDYNGLYFENAAGTTKTLLYQHAATDSLIIKDIVNNVDRVKFKNNGDVQLNATSKLYLDGGSDTYIDEVASDQLRLVAGGTEVLKGYSSGAIDMYGGSTTSRSINIGANRSGNGYSWIDLVGDATYTDYGARFIRNNGGPNTSSEIIHRGTGVLALKAYDAGSVRFYTSNTERVRVDSSGNVSIGAFTPGYKLDISSGDINLSQSQGIRINGNYRLYGDGNYTTLRKPDGSIALYIGGSDAANYYDHTRHRFRPSGGGSNYYMTVSTGGLGISRGSDDAEAKLHIGDADNSNNALASNVLGTTSGDSIDYIKLECDSTNANQLIFSSERIANGSDWTTTRERIYRKVDASNMGYIQFGSSFAASTADMISFGEVGVGDYMGITGDGKVGIGTNSPTGKLDVVPDTDGYSRIGRARVGYVGFADYAGFSHIDRANVSQYAMIQQSDGATFINSASGTPIYFRESNATKMILTGGRLLIGDTSVHYSGTDLQVGNTSDSANGIQIQTSTTGNGYVLFGDGTGASAYRGQVQYNHQNNFMAIRTNGLEAMRIDSSGNVLIGGTSASGHGFNLEVLNDHAYVKGPDGWNGTGDKAIVALGSGVSNESFGCGYVYGTGLVLSTYKVSGGGDFGSSTQNSLVITDTVGQAKFINDVVAFATSDKRLKENVKPLDNALEKINKINGVEFDWIDGKDEHGNSVHGNEGHDIGVIAQEIEEVLPEVVHTRDNGYKAVKYEKIVPLLIEAIKEQQEQINKLEEKLNG